jgi:acylphosphatase
MVQGVGFRWFVLRRAQLLHLRGYARNLPDGRVEVVAAGPEDALAELAQALRVGPPRARVDALETADVTGDPVPAGGFDIR